MKTTKTENTSLPMNPPAENPQNAISVMDKAMYNKLMKGISDELGKVEKSYLSMAFMVHHIYVQKLYEIDGFKNIYDWSAEKFKLARGTTNNYVNICEKFGQKEKDGTVKALLPEFQKYSSSQLIPMLSMEKAALDVITPDMTVREIKAEKKKSAGKSGKDRKKKDETGGWLEDDKNPKIHDNLMTILQVKDVEGLKTPENLSLIDEMFKDFCKCNPKIPATISIDIRWHDRRQDENVSKAAGKPKKESTKKPEIEPQKEGGSL